MNFRYFFVASLMLLGLAANSLQADFVQCPGGPCGDPQGTTNNADLINGSEMDDDIEAQAGDDLIFGGLGADEIRGDEGEDVIFAGQGSDLVNGSEGNDLLSAGPDDGLTSQFAEGRDGDDIVNVLAGEVTTCLFIEGDAGNDTVNLIGFGPYSATKPFGQTIAGFSWIFVVDPITGGFVFIGVDEVNSDGSETVNGLPSPNVTILAPGSEAELSCPEFPFPV